MDEGWSIGWLPKAAVYLFGQLAIGAVIVRRLAAGADGGASPGIDAWLLTVARAVAALLLAALAFRLVTQTVAAFGPSDAWTVENLRIVAIDSRWGRMWRLQLAAAAIMVVATVAVPSRRGRWWLFDGGAVAFGLAVPLLGHAAGDWLRYGLHITHVVAAACWLGTLGVIVLASWRAQTRALADRIVKMFSPLALTAAGAAAASGVVLASIYVGSWSALSTTPYGRVLLLKLVAAAVVVACGWANWRTARRGRPLRPAVVTAEWLAALVVLALTGVLTETEHPGA